MLDCTQPLKTPVVLLAFNKPEKTKQVFDVIRKVKPLKLYVAVDAPRKNTPTDIELCERVRKLVQKVDWNCETNYLFHEQNLGCSRSGKAIWDWVFETEEEIIFLEDDGIPSKSFFWFAQELLEKYRYDKQVAYIGGVNYGIKKGDASYFFTKSSGPGTYVMAFWKRTYDLYEYMLESYNETIETQEFKDSFPNKLAYRIMKRNFERYLTCGGETYDIQIIYLLHKYDMCCIVPNVNMGTNIGWDFDATNYKGGPNGKMAKKLGNRPRFELTEINHPGAVSIDLKFDQMYYRHRQWGGNNFFYMFYLHYIKRPLSLIPVLRNMYKLIKREV